MVLVKLGDVARECRVKCTDDLSKYKQVGLEHLDEGSITLTRCDEPNTADFTKFFHKGQILFGRRNVYLQKAVVAPFDGVCSGDITVLEEIPGKILPEYLPFVIQNTAFFEWADRKATGTMSRRIKWDQLHQYEFNLPDVTEQKRLADLLWAIEDGKKKIYEAINKNRSVKKSYLEALVNSDRKDFEYCTISKDFEILKNNSHPREKLTSGAGDVLNIHYGDIHTLYSELLDANDCRIPYLVSEIDTSKINDEDYCKNGDIILTDASEDYSEIGKAVEMYNITLHKIVAGLHTIHLRPKSKQFVSGYLSYVMESSYVHNQIVKITVGSKIYAITKNDIKLIQIPVLSKDEQIKLVSILKKIDEVKQKLIEDEKEITKLEKSILQLIN